MSDGWGREIRLAALVAERGLSTSGFRRSMRALVEEFCPPLEDELAEQDEGDEPIARAEQLEHWFEAWFGFCRSRPVAYRIIRGDGDDIWSVTVEVYEVENTTEIGAHKLREYGDMADREGPHIELHIVDRWDHEIVIPSDDLMSFMTYGLHPSAPEQITLEYKKVLQEADRERLKEARSRAIAQHHTTVVVDRNGERSVRRLKRQLSKTKKWKAAYDAVRELGVKL